MSKDEFRRLFEESLEVAAGNAEQKLGHAVSRTFRVRLHGGGCAGALVDPREAVDRLYLGEGRFYRIIDVAVIEIAEDYTICFVRASDHAPGTFEQTWNSPAGSGPFKQLIAKEIRVIE